MKKQYTMPDTQYWRFISGNICQVCKKLYAQPQNPEEDGMGGLQKSSK